MPIAGLRYGLFPGTEIEAVFAPYSESARRSLSLRYAPIPAMWALNLSYDVLSRGQYTTSVEAGTTFELGLPWMTPRLAPRLAYRRVARFGTSFESWHPRIDLGFETRAHKAVALGLDLDYGFTAESTLNLGTRFRLLGNLGGAVFASLPTWALADPTTYKAGAIAAMRF
jgi:hypothetical protein